MSILKKVASVSGPVMRVLMGAGAFALLVIGIKNKTGRKPLDSCSGEISSNRKDSRNR